MRSTLAAIASHPRLQLQIVATGMHLDPAHGKTVNQIRREGWQIAATVPWKSAGNNLVVLAEQTGLAAARLARAYEKLKANIVLVVGDRVEAFAAASAAHLAGKIVAHVHGGDRALGQVDDALRHAITKLSHLHFPATKTSAERIARLGEDRWRIHQVGSPGLDGIRSDALDWSDLKTSKLAAHRKKFALVLLHPTCADNEAEYRGAKLLIDSCIATGFAQIIIVHPNNDPGAQGIVHAIEKTRNPRVQSFRNLARPAFLGLLRDAAVLVGNSSSGIIEAASFGTPVVDVGPRQAGRERGDNVVTVPFNRPSIRKALSRIWNDGQPRRHVARNIYGDGKAAGRIARTLAKTPITPELRHKLIAY
jgi:UDP-N-acetylglucosamine 2-epimerase (non-hydrolysing)/GDP/UDP-N,N'-diacetylbacillosamine 2-epimerase (hydrolysing)